MTHSLKTRAIAEARIKTEQLYSEILSHLLRDNLIAEAFAPDFQTRHKKNLLRYRASLKRMGVSRGTVQRIQTSARKKVATALSGCKALVFEKTTCKEE